MKKNEIKYKVWLEKDGEIIIGLGRDELLRKVQETGSIKKAAESIGISYKKALEYIKAMEKRTGKKLVETKRGGKERGGSSLTEEALILLNRFEKIKKDFDSLVRKLESNG
ncbi:winged helix-turn-helix domain-containing protein [Hydrogenivirga sp. 128-5-R1-1]|uniref:winged helix-turn-helix domain-containing protein n=1 Tax=Hydrogenivirga sp. 128-5-R1-1 TaxID=392423 RepID=UPI00015F1474|nr:winged helix-turn-helix domain-containing protein [Hydrogenivirga sp. 128-5-R1-1]EDP74191.1 molybdenum-pterin-binding protein, conjectural [Hydrogenivirga sp. 128-5-R1-1]